MKAPYVKSNRPLCPKGTFMARVIRIVYIGTVKTTWKGEEKEIPKLWITWELPTEKAVFKEGEPEMPFIISQEFSHSMGKKSNLRPITENIIGTTLTDDEAYGFDHDELLDKPCQITIVHEVKNENTYANVSAVSGLLKGVTCPSRENELKVLSFDKWDEKYFEDLPKFIKDKIMSSKEYKAMKGLDIDTSDISPADISGIPF